MARSVRVNYITNILDVDLSLQGSTLSSLASGNPSFSFPGLPHPNEPVGFTRFAEYDFTTALNEGIGNSNGTEIDGCAWKVNAASNYQVVSDPTAPRSPNGVADVRFPAGLADGSGPGLYQMWDTCSETNNTEYSKIYNSIWIKLVGPDWEAHPVLTKWLGYWGFGRNGGGRPPTNIAGVFYGSGISSSFTYSFNQQDEVTRNLHQNVNTSVRVLSDVWHHFEILMEVNSAANVADGILKVWQDNVITLNYGNVVWKTTGFTSGFYGRRYDPVWGGIGGSSKVREDHIYLDHEYMSGVV